MFDFLEEIFHQLRDIPGFSFVRKLQTRFQVIQMRHQRRTERFRVLKSRFQGSTKSAQKLGKKAGPAKRRNEQ